MESKNRVNHFDIVVDDYDRAQSFYKSTFGWKFEKWDGPFDYWLVTTGGDDNPGGINGGMIKNDGKVPKFNKQITINVASVDKSIEKIRDNGGEIEGEKMSIPGVGYMAFFKDTEENVLGIMENDYEAK